MTKHVVVIGGGVIGLSAAAECAKRGHRVSVIDRDPQNRGSSLGNAGMIVPSHFVPLAAPGMVALGLKWMANPESPFYIKPRLNWDLFSWAMRFWRAGTAEHVKRCGPLLRDLHLASREVYSRLADSGEQLGLKKNGLLMLCKTQKALDEESHTAIAAHKLGIATNVLDAKQLAALEPHVTMDVQGGIHYPGDCHLDPQRYVQSREDFLRQKNCQLLYQQEITGWKLDGDRIVAVRTDLGDIEGDEFVLAGGTWSSDLSRKLGLSLPIQAGKGYSVTKSEPIELPRICSIFVEARVAVTPIGDRLRFGGTMEIAGINDRINPRRVLGILKSIPNYYPKFKVEDFDGIAPWQGMRPCSPDGLPYLGRTAIKRNLIIATGHAMMGLSLAPVTGEMVGAMVDGEPTSIDISLLNPDRYAAVRKAS